MGTLQVSTPGRPPERRRGGEALAPEHDLAQPYVLDQGWSEERRRLTTLAAIYDPGTFRLLEQFGTGPGWACLEVGAGEGSVARWLADRAGPDGRVVAVDIDPQHIAAESGFEVRTHDILDGPPEHEAFDVAHARAVIEWIPDRSTAIKNRLAALKPGGLLLVEDFDIAAAGLTYPASHNRQAVIAAVGQLAAAGGADLYFGRELRARFTDAGLVDVHSEVRSILHGGGEPTTDFERLTIEQLAPLLIGHGLLTQDQVDEALTDLRDPNSFGYPPVMVAVWGRKPR